MMTIMELGALGELLGAIAVFATLIYLSVQVRQNTRSIDAAPVSYTHLRAHET